MKAKAKKIMEEFGGIGAYLAYVNSALIILAATLVLLYGFSFFSLMGQGIFIDDFYSESGGREERITDLEARYVAMKSAITMELAEDMGYREVKNPKYIVRKTAGQGLSFGNEI